MPDLRLTTAIVTFALALPLAGHANGIAGPYLAGRQASMTADYKSAADYFARSLIIEPTNTTIMESAILAEIGKGDFDKALVIAQGLDAAKKQNGLADLVILASDLKAGNFDAVLAGLDKGRTAGALIDGLTRGWAQFGKGQMTEATAAFDKLAENKDFRSIVLYHKSLALALVGDFEGADKILADPANVAVRSTRGAILAHAQILSQLERDADALKLLEQTITPDPSDDVVNALRAELQAGKAVPFTAVRNANDGVAEVFLAVASAVGQDAKAGNQAAVDTLIFARTAHFLRPDLSEAVLLIASDLEVQGQYQMAIDTLDSVAADSPDYISAAIGRAQAMLADGQADGATEALQQLAKAKPDRIEIWAMLGDTLRRNDKFADAIDAYDKAIALKPVATAQDWSLFYARAICHERSKNWDKAEPDFRKALELSPDQPQVLNYLGYSYLEQKTNLDEALSMIQRASKARPDDGPISDSLGWAYFRLGRNDDAVREMEHAILLMPVDSVVNDHLGDVYWAVGRKREAEVQWRRALSFKPETEEEATRIRRKLEVGLDAVLAEEKATVVDVTNNGG